MRIATAPDHLAIRQTAPAVLARAGAVRDNSRWNAAPLFATGSTPAACVDGSAVPAAPSN
jgi:hypothetical protein